MILKPDVFFKGLGSYAFYAVFFFFCMMHNSTLFSVTIEEKREELRRQEEEGDKKIKRLIRSFNEDVDQIKGELKEKYEEAIAVASVEEVDSNQCERLLGDISTLRKRLFKKESEWRDDTSKEMKWEGESYSLFDQDEISISDLVMEYGAKDYLYVIPSDVSQIRISVKSALPIPRECWSELLEVILLHNGIGSKPLNAYAKQLFVMKQDLLGADQIICSEKELDVISSATRVIYVFFPKIENLKAVFHFFDRFRDVKRVFVHQAGQGIAICASQRDIKQLLTLYETVWNKEATKITRVLSSPKLNSEEITKILKAFFNGLSDQSRGLVTKGGNDLTVHPLSQENSVVLIGPASVVDQAEKIVRDTENQVEDFQEMVIYTYTCLHSDPTDLAEILEKVYSSLMTSSLEGMKNQSMMDLHGLSAYDLDMMDPDGGMDGSVPLGYPHMMNSESQKKQKPSSFIPYGKTGKVMMVVKRELLEKVKEVVRQLDVPKRMVEIEVLLVEVKKNCRLDSGLNLLKVGSNASGAHEAGVLYDHTKKAASKGLFEFFFSRPKSQNFPAFDAVYNFLISQDDVRVNASPRIATINQTPATIALVDEISINNGAAPIENNANITFEKSFTRQQFGITITVTPTIHDPNPDDPIGEIFVTLENNITFDTIKSDDDDRPDVQKRHIENQVRLQNEGTACIGGLTRKASQDKSEKIPFFGELPCFGKLFGTSTMMDESTEMIIFITPTVLKDPLYDVSRLRDEAIAKRPGDLPEFITRLKGSRERGKVRQFEKSFQLMLGKGNSDDAFYL